MKCALKEIYCAVRNLQLQVDNETALTEQLVARSGTTTSVAVPEPNLLSGGIYTPTDFLLQAGATIPSNVQVYSTNGIPLQDAPNGSLIHIAGLTIMNQNGTLVVTGGPAYQLMVGQTVYATSPSCATPLLVNPTDKPIVINSYSNQAVNATNGYQVPTSNTLSQAISNFKALGTGGDTLQLLNGLVLISSGVYSPTGGAMSYNFIDNSGNKLTISVYGYNAFYQYVIGVVDPGFTVPPYDSFCAISVCNAGDTNLRVVNTSVASAQITLPGASVPTPVPSNFHTFYGNSAVYEGANGVNAYFGGTQSANVKTNYYITTDGKDVTFPTFQPYGFVVYCMNGFCQASVFSVNYASNTPVTYPAATSTTPGTINSNVLIGPNGSAGSTFKVNIGGVDVTITYTQANQTTGPLTYTSDSSFTLQPNTTYCSY